MLYVVPVDGDAQGRALLEGARNMDRREQSEEGTSRHPRKFAISQPQQ